MLRICFVTALVFGASAAMADGMVMNSGAAATPADKAFTSAMDRMMANMTAKPTGHADQDFVTMMIPHHEGAVDMAEVELKFGKNPQLRALARTIVADQQKEIEEMRGWLRAHPR